MKRKTTRYHITISFASNATKPEVETIVADMLAQLETLEDEKSRKVEVVESDLRILYGTRICPCCDSSYDWDGTSEMCLFCEDHGCSLEEPKH